LQAVRLTDSKLSSINIVDARMFGFIVVPFNWLEDVAIILTMVCCISFNSCMAILRIRKSSFPVTLCTTFSVHDFHWRVDSFDVVQNSL